MIVTPPTTLAPGSSKKPAVDGQHAPPSRPVSGERASVQLSIGELVLDGFAASSRHAIRDATERELTRLLADGELPWPSEDSLVSRRDAGALRMPADLSPTETGRRLAVAILKGVTS